MSNVAITGHRPERLNNEDRIIQELKVAFEDLNTYRVIQGMAPGVDIIAARTAYKANIPFVAARPYPGHRNYVANSYKEWLPAYDQTLERAEEIVDVCESYEGPWVFQRRNEWMVDRCDHLIAVWDGIKKGGTWNAISYAKKVNKPITYVLA